MVELVPLFQLTVALPLEDPLAQLSFPAPDAETLPLVIPVTPLQPLKVPLNVYLIAWAVAFSPGEKNAVPLREHAPLWVAPAAPPVVAAITAMTAAPASAADRNRLDFILTSR